MKRSMILRQLMINRDMKVSDISKQSGIAYSTVKSILENGTGKASYINICKICASLGITPDGLEHMVKENTIHELQLSKEDSELLSKYQSLDDPGRDHVNAVLNWELERTTHAKESANTIERLQHQLAICSIPSRIFAYYGKIAAAGTSVEFSDIAAGVRTYPGNEINKNADYVIGVNGTSMEPEYFDGDIVYVQKTDHIETGDIGIFQKGNNIYIKKAGENGLISLNPYYPPLTPDGDRITVLGKVLGKAEED